MAKKKSNESSNPPTQHAAAVSKLRPGTGSRRVNTRFIIIYGGAKTRKTGAVSTLPPGRTKWMVSDPNCVPTLRALYRLPADEDLYEVKNLASARTMLAELLELVEKEGVEALGIDYLVVDSVTQFSDWHQQDIAKSTNQRFMGDNSKNNGWQQFNAEFGAFLDDLAILSQHVTVVAIAHAAPKMDLAKGDWGGLALTPQMALKAGRLANWVLYKTLRTFAATEDVKEDDYVTITEQRGERVATESVLHTRPNGLWMASANSMKLLAEEPGDLLKLLEKDGLA